MNHFTDDPSMRWTEVTVAVGIKDGMAGAPSQVWALNVALPRKEARAIHDELERIVHQEPMSYELQAREGRFSWGADGGHQLQIILFLAQSTANGIIAAATMELFQRLLKKQEDYGFQTEEQREIANRDEAISYAKWTVVSKYSHVVTWLDSLPGPDDPLELVSEAHNLRDGSWKIELKDQAGAAYRVTLGILDGVLTATMIERRAPQVGEAD